MLAYGLTDPLSRSTTAVRRAAAGRFIALHAVPARKCAVTPNAIDLAEYTADPARREATRIEFSASSRFTWLAPGRLTPTKDYPDLPRAFAKLCSSQPDAELWIAGQGTDGQLSALEAFAAALHLLCGRECLWCLPRPWRWKCRSSRPRPQKSASSLPMPASWCRQKSPNGSPRRCARTGCRLLRHAPRGDAPRACASGRAFRATRVRRIGNLSIASSAAQIRFGSSHKKKAGAVRLWPSQSCFCGPAVRTETRPAERFFVPPSRKVRQTFRLPDGSTHRSGYPVL
jgi:hypothetical protein